MQQWIPRTQTLEPKIWGQVGLRQGLYMGLGVFAGIFFLVALAPFGIGPRIVAALMALAGGATAGFIKIKGISPERYLFHRLRFALRRKGLGVWNAREALAKRVEYERARPVARQQMSRKPVFRLWEDLAPLGRAARPITVSMPNECMVEAGTLGLGFQLAAVGIMVAAVTYFASGAAR